MYIQKLTGNRIKVTVTLADLMCFNMTIDQLRPDSKELNNFLFFIMEAINQETDFNPYSGQIIMEATPWEQGVYIIVSKLGFDKSVHNKKIRSISVKARSAKPLVFYFNDFNEMCGAMTEIGSEAVLCCELYHIDGNYCVIINSSADLEAAKLILSEHSFRKSERPMANIYVREHGRAVASGAKLLNIVNTFHNN